MYIERNIQIQREFNVNFLDFNFCPLDKFNKKQSNCGHK